MEVGLLKVVVTSPFPSGHPVERGPRENLVKNSVPQTGFTSANQLHTSGKAVTNVKPILWVEQ